MCTPSFDSMELTFMAQFSSAVSPTSSLPTPPTYAQLPLSSLSYTTPPSTDNLRLDTTFYDGNLFVTSPFEPPFLVKPCGPFDISCLQFAESFDPIHPSIVVPASPQPPPMPASETESYELTTLQNFSRSYTSSSGDTTSDTVALASPPPRKPTRMSKKDRGIKCDHCGVDKTPLWRKVPRKVNSYHWYKS